jgi:tetratricopeptide (TPR) repeat protein
MHPKIITFYSYKGGVGRSMALANVAWMLAEKYKVIVIDWDLEAPGLHKFFNISQESMKNGLIDLFYDYKDLLRNEEIPTNEELLDIEKYLEKVPENFNSGSLFLLSAGKFDKDYATKVNKFNWEDFYENWHGYGFIEYLKEQLKKKADFILVDSRTGITDIGGICTVQMPDAVVLLFSFNEQNIFGIETIGEKIIKSAEFMEKESPKLILIPSRIEKYLEQSRLNHWAEIASQHLAKYLTNRPENETPLEYMEKNLIPYSGYYSFGENIVNETDFNRDLIESYENLKDLILKEAEQENTTLYNQVDKEDIEDIALKPVYEYQNEDKIAKIKSKSMLFIEERPFVDREIYIQAFRENIQKSGTKDYNVLSYYGIAGSGKSKLQKELQKILDNEHPEIFWAAINLDVKKYREVGTFLVTLRNKIQEKCKLEFYLFNTIYAIYLKKLHPEIPLQKENFPFIKEKRFFNKIIDILNEVRGSLESIAVKLIFDVINNTSDNIINLFRKQHIEIDKLTVMEASELEKLLPGFFAADFISYLGASSKAYVFIDSYEAIWESLRDKGSFYEKDEWIRDNLILNMLGVSWVICGREKLSWSEFDQDWTMYLEQHEIDELPISYCKEFLDNCGIKDTEIQTIITKASQGVPYYLNLSVDTFEKISQKRQPVHADFEKTQPKIFDTFVKYLYSNEIRALEVLSIPNFWDRDLFKILMKKFDSGFPSGAFSELIKFSFIKTYTDERFSIQQLMRKSLQTRLEPIDREGVHEFLFTYYDSKIKNIDIQAITLEDEISLTEAFYHAKESLEAENLLNWLIARSDPFNKAAFWQLIVPMYEETLQVLEEKLGPEHPSVATTLNNLAALYSYMGAYEKALPLYQRALDIREKMLGPQHPSVATTLNNLAALYSYMGAYEKALPLYQRALYIREKVLGPQHPDVANSLNNLALLYKNIGDYEQALPLYQMALDIREKVLGPQHPDVATSLNDLALLYNYMGNYEQALPLYQRALDIREKVLGPQHPYVATTLNNLAGLYHHMGDYEKALPLYQMALDIREKVLGPQHPDVANSLNNLALLYNYMGDYEQALSLSQRALDIREKVLGSEHPDVAATLNTLALLYNYMGDYEQALSLSQRALEIYEKVLGQQHPDVATTLNTLAGLYKNMGDYEKALPLYQRALEIYEKVLGSEHPDVATTLNNLALLYNYVGDYEQALPLYQRALDIREKVLGLEHPEVAATLNNLAGLYDSMGKCEKALPLYQRALEIIEKALGPKHPNTIIIRNNFMQSNNREEKKEN